MFSQKDLFFVSLTMASMKASLRTHTYPIKYILEMKTTIIFVNTFKKSVTDTAQKLDYIELQDEKSA